jgi:hypothetical protein
MAYREATDKDWDTISRLVDEKEMSLSNLEYLDRWVNREPGRLFDAPPGAIIDWLNAKPPRNKQ